MAENPEDQTKTEPLFLVRSALESDIASISAINAHYVLNTVLTFRYEPATHQQLLTDFHSIKNERLPYMVATEKASNAVVGYCYATRFRPPKAGYRPTLELSIFCDSQYLSQGIGSLLLTELLRIFQQPEKYPDVCLKAKGDAVGVRSVMACMAVDETGPGGGMALKRFYERFGFEEVGRLKGVGYKFERWIDTVYMQLELK
ncbi:hypothetical protein N0V90_005344 [Kalmusia sp. IMI 367209]|nr:hypothetical protein N0V90_005344 [Kalmusia sp. IMI 367209]